MGKFKFTYTEIEGVFVAEPAVFPDERGYFMETYNENDFKEEGIDLTFVQDNQSKSSKGVLRGLHFQKTQPQGKLVRVISFPNLWKMGRREIVCREQEAVIYSKRICTRLCCIVR